MKRFFTCWTESNKIFSLKFDEHGGLEIWFEFQADSDFGINSDLVEMKNESLKDGKIPLISNENQLQFLTRTNKQDFIKL